MATIPFKGTDLVENFKYSIFHAYYYQFVELQQNRESGSSFRKFYNLCAPGPPLGQFSPKTIQLEFFIALTYRVSMK